MDSREKVFPIPSLEDEHRSNFRNMFLVFFRIPGDGQNNKEKTLFLRPHSFVRPAVVISDRHDAVDVASSEAGAEAQWLLCIPPVNERRLFP
jgi:hypothetical protein